MTVPEAFETLGLPEGADWSQVQTAYERLRARSPGSAERERLLEDALLVLRRELLKAHAPQAAVPVSASAPRRRV
ncbi:MAG: hypothetical protein HYV15_05230, partial [Elusimicrobia bacterium]|nr:hypothetical protein [Elusimicrobiota bacterium]